MGPLPLILLQRINLYMRSKVFFFEFTIFFGVTILSVPRKTCTAKSFVISHRVVRLGAYLKVVSGGQRMGTASTTATTQAVHVHAGAWLRTRQWLNK